MNSVELSELDLRYENYRIKNKTIEKRLMHSILEQGILDPLKGVCTGEQKLLLDGFKRLRCAKKLNIGNVPYLSMGEDEATGIIDLMRESFTKGLSVIEQAKLIEELQSNYGLSLVDIANRLSKSRAWVSVRVAMNRELTPCAAGHILSGKFPVRAYLYTILPFTRVNGVCSEQVDQFIERVAGQGLSTRNIDALAQEYFKGNKEMKDQIEHGNLQWVLDRIKGYKQVKRSDSSKDGVLKILEKTLSGMQKINRCQWGTLPKSGKFLAQANLLAFHVLNEFDHFNKKIKELYDRSQSKNSCSGTF